MSLPKVVLPTLKVKALRDGIVAGQMPTTVELLDLIGSHERLRATTLAQHHRMRAAEEERTRLQGQIEMIARAQGRAR